MKEKVAYKIMQDQGTPLLSHDDRLLLRAQKSEITLKEGWKSNAGISYREGRPVITGYYKWNSQGEVIGRATPEEWQALPIGEKRLYFPAHERAVDLPGCKVILRNNQIDIRIINLYEDLRSRYRIALEHATELARREILEYRPRAEITEKRIMEAIRQRLKKHLKPTEYEYNLLVTGELARVIHRDLILVAKEKIGSTIYLQGYKRHDTTEAAVKMYDTGERDGEERGERYKLEITLLKAYFKKEGITTERLLEQPDIQELMTEKLVKVLSKVYNNLSGEAQKMIAQAVEYNITDMRKAPREIAIETLKNRKNRTLTERVDTLERIARDHERRLARLERK